MLQRPISGHSLRRTFWKRSVRDHAGRAGQWHSSDHSRLRRNRSQWVARCGNESGRNSHRTIGAHRPVSEAQCKRRCFRVRNLGVV